SSDVCSSDLVPMGAATHRAGTEWIHGESLKSHGGRHELYQQPAADFWDHSAGTIRQIARHGLFQRNRVALEPNVHVARRRRKRSGGLSDFERGFCAGAKTAFKVAET